MPTRSRYRRSALGSPALLCLAVAAEAAAQTPAALDADRHPASPSYVSPLPLKPPPLDLRTSWVGRFAGDENFRDTVATAAAAPAASNPSVAAAGPVTASGTVRAVRAAQRKVKIEHGPIEALGMPAMTMLFSVAEPVDLDGLQPGQKLRFALDSGDGGFVITRLLGEPAETTLPRPAPATAAAVSDARGTITSVRPGQRKVKVKHGPIARLGMPAMTMLFSVAEPVAIGELAEGQVIEFNVDDSSGGYVITSVRPVSER